MDTVGAREPERATTPGLQARAQTLFSEGTGSTMSSTRASRVQVPEIRSNVMALQPSSATQRLKQARSDSSISELISGTPMKAA